MGMPCDGGHSPDSFGTAAPVKGKALPICDARRRPASVRSADAAGADGGVVTGWSQLLQGDGCSAAKCRWH